MGLNDDLRRDFPALYPPKPPYYILDVPEGWRDILYRLSERLVGMPVRVGEVKSKFGGLRCYFSVRGSRAANEIDAAVMEAENASWVTCDVCGAPGMLRETESHWLVVRCDEHAEGSCPVEPDRRDHLPVALLGQQAPWRASVTRGLVKMDDVRDAPSNSRAVAVADLLERGQRVSEAGMAAIERAEAAGLTFGPEVFFGMLTVRRAADDFAHVWLGVGDTVSVLGDASDADGALLLSLTQALDGCEEVQ
jgi:hypothetical protein